MLHPKVEIRIPVARLESLLGTASALNPPTASYRRSVVRRAWSCGCVVAYAFDRFEDARWTPCEAHVLV
jgi:hypothetical protein